MTNEQFNDFKEFFDLYSYSFIEHFPDLTLNLNLKYCHSLRVIEAITTLGEKMNLSPNDLLIAKTIALFHDLGRYIQYVKYKTFSDTHSQDHASIGVAIIEEDPAFDNLPLEEQDIILTAIRNHSKKTIEPLENKRYEFFCKLIRDADKIDIFKIVTDYYSSPESNNTLTLDLPDDDGLSLGCLNAIAQKQLIDKHALITVNDYKLLQISWIFDINFKESMDIICEKKYIDCIFDSLPESHHLEKIKPIIYDSMKNMKTSSYTSSLPNSTPKV